MKKAILVKFRRFGRNEFCIPKISLLIFHFFKWKEVTMNIKVGISMPNSKIKACQKDKIIQKD
jgi:hypothetical protein